MDIEEVRDLVKKTKWYHGWEILPGINTGGKSITDPKKALDSYGVPDNLDNLRVLDIGAWDGPYSFDLERRGATVVSYDIQDPDATAYNVAHKILDSKCTYIRGSVYDLDQDKTGKFDIVFFLGVYYHLKHPLIAFKKIRDILKPGGIVFFEGAILDYAWNVDNTLEPYKEKIIGIRDLPVTYYTSGEYSRCWSNWYIPTKECLRHWLVSSGFHEIVMSEKEKSSRAYGSAKFDKDADLKEHGISGANLKL
ncbi:MAG: DUF1698 domain-containing protein [bacterium]|nr:DUF1698 domain-containing protein [bacterium]